MHQLAKLAILFPVFAVLFGCAAPKHNYAPISHNISEPPVGTVNIASVGDTMLRQGSFREHDAIRLSQEVTVGGIGNYTFTPGHFLKTGEDESLEYYKPSQYPGSGTVIRGAITDPFQAMAARKNEQSLCGVSVFNAIICKEGVDFERVKEPIATADSFQQTLIYSGKVGSKINVGYREFSANVARPAFNNDVEYDLSESSVIGYKGAVLEILEATNQSIKYRVKANFNTTR